MMSFNDLNLIKMTDEQRALFKEQVEYSTQKMQELKNDNSKEGKEEFFRHAEIIKDMRSRLETHVNSQKNIQNVNEALSNLYR